MACTTLRLPSLQEFLNIFAPEDNLEGANLADTIWGEGGPLKMASQSDLRDER